MYNLHLHIQCNDIHVRVFMKLELHIRNINKSIKFVKLDYGNRRIQEEWGSPL